MIRKITARFAFLSLLALFLAMPVVAMAATNSYTLSYLAVTNNPLKGFTPYSGSYNTFPYSMEWNYLPLRSLMTGPTNFDWSSLDSLLTTDTGRGHHTVFRVYLDYPTLTTGIPQYLLDAGLVTYNYTNYDNNDISLCPDYENPLLDQAMTNFIAALGARYDGDPRIGFVELGLLGYWGEWHTYPETNWFASVTVQNEVLAAYTNAFHQTRLLVRWPAGSYNASTLPIGYHDDSFAYDTIAPPSYNFLGLLQAAGETAKWKTQPIGGEVYPPEQLCMWQTPTNCVPQGQAFSSCVTATHASWQLDQGIFDPGFTGARLAQALAAAQSLGYEFFVSNTVIIDATTTGPLNATIRIGNTGVAPFYYDWPIQLGALNSSNQLVKTWTANWQLSSLLPGPATNLWTWSQANHGLLAGQYKLLLGIPNPITNGIPLSFADSARNADLAGWLTLGQFSVVAGSARPTVSASALPSSIEVTVSNASPGEWTVEDTSDFVLWNSLVTTNATSSTWSITDAVSSLMRFYRVVSQP